MSKKTQTTRVSTWFYNLFSTKAEKEETTLLRKLDELAESLHILNVDEVILNDFLNTAYKEDETNTPRYVFEVLNALMNYSNKINNNVFNKYSFKQFIDRWNIVAYYINSHIYTNVLKKSSLTDKELQERAESTLALTFLFDKNVDDIINYTNEIMKEIDPYENATISKKSKARIMTKIFKHKKLMSCLENELIVRKESTIVELYNQLNNKYYLKTDGKSVYGASKYSYGFTNKIAYLIYNNYKDERLDELPYFVNEEFLSDIFTLLHNYVGNHFSSDIYDAKALESAFIITKAVKTIDAYHTFNDSYLKGNLEHSNDFSKLDDALEADINSLKQTRYTYSAEMRMRTPMHIVEQTTKTGARYILRPEIKKVVLKHLINLCNPIYAYIRENEGEILHFRDSSKDLSIYSEDKNAQIAIAMKDKCYYINFILYIKGEENTILSTITIDMKHDSLEKIYYCIQEQNCSKIKIEEDLSFYYSSNDLLQLSHKQGTLMLHGKLRESFIEVITTYINSNEFIENKRFNTLNYGLI